MYGFELNTIWCEDNVDGDGDSDDGDGDGDDGDSDDGGSGGGGGGGSGGGDSDDGDYVICSDIDGYILLALLASPSHHLMILRRNSSCALTYYFIHRGRHLSGNVFQVANPNTKPG